MKIEITSPSSSHKGNQVNDGAERMVKEEIGNLFFQRKAVKNNFTQIFPVDKTVQ